MIATKEVSHGDEPIQGSNTNGDEEKQLLNKLVRSWKSHCVRGLKVRHEMGALLNGFLDSPTKRQPHGEGVLRKAAQRLSVSESELSRMRWLAHLFGDVESLKDEQPDCRSWTDFKRILPDLKSSNGNMGAARRTIRSQPALRGVAKTIDNISARIDRLDACPEVDHCKNLLEDLKAAVKACEEHMSVEVKANRKDAEPKASEPVAAASD